MQLPVDIGGLFKIATNLKDAADTPIHASVYIDDTAAADICAHVRGAFASAAANTRVSITYITQNNCEGGEAGPGVLPYVDANDDFAVIVAGVGEGVGAAASALRSAGVPAMVVSNMPGIVGGLAECSGFAIPAGDIVAPEKLRFCPIAAVDKYLPRKNKSGRLEHADQVLLPVSAESLKILDERMGRWIADACSHNSVALSLAFPFVRRPLATECKDATAAQNAAVGIVPFLGGADLPVMVLNQCKMVLQIATAYGHPMDKDRIKEVAAVILSGYAFRGLARMSLRKVPALGSVVGGVMGFAGTQAIGSAAIEYFEGGGDLVGLANVLQQAIKGTLKKAEDLGDTAMGQKAKDALKSAVAGLGPKAAY